MKRLLVLLVLFGFVASAPRARDLEPQTSMIVSTAWLANHLKDPDLVLLHVGDRKGFDEKHLPGARFVALDAISIRKTEANLTLELLPVATLVERLEALGISNSSRVVVYFGADWVTPTTRVFFTLDYVGLGDRTSILDGGLPVWELEKRPLTTEVAEPARGRLTPHPRPEILASAEWMKANLRTDGVVVVDSRDPRFYEGKEAGSMPRAGRIPGARNVPYSSLVTDGNKLKDPSSLKQLFAGAGATGRQTVVTYCHIGQQASLDYFVARYLGYPAKLYDGSFEDWSRRADWPIEPAPAVKPPEMAGPFPTTNRSGL